MTLTVNEVFRDFVTDGVPSSGAWKPLKKDIRALLNGMAGGGSGIYDFIPASNTGAGTANALKATTAVELPAAPYGALIAVNVYADNTASPVTVQFNGGTVYTVKTNSGNDVTVGGLKAGSVLAGYISGTTFRLLSDQASAAIQAAAEAAAADAVAAAGAVTSAPQWAFPGKAALALFSPAAAPDFITFAGYAVAGDGGGAIYKKVGSEPTHAGKVQDGNGQWYELAEANPNPIMFGAAGDGSTDDTTALSNMLTYAPAKADIDLKWKTYKHTSLSIAKDVTFRNGALTSATSTGIQISIDPAARFVARNVKFTGGGSETTLTSHNIIYQLGASSADRAVGFDFEGCEFSGCGGVAIAAKFSDNIRLVNNKVSNFAYAGIQVLSCDNGLAEGNRVEGREAAGSSGDCYGMAFTHNSYQYNLDPNAGTPQAANPFCSGWRVIGNTVIAPKRWEGIDFHGGYKNVVAFNKVYGAAYGMMLGGSSGDATGYDGHDLIVMGNIVTAYNEDDTLSGDTNPSLGIVIQGGGSPPHFRKNRVTVTGNTISGYGGVTPLGVESDISAAIYANTGTINFVISDNVITEWAGCAIILSQSTGSGVINNNVFSGTRFSIALDAIVYLTSDSPGRLQVIGNVLEDEQGNAPAYGVKSSGTVKARITYGSDFRRASTAELGLSFTSPGAVRSVQYA